MLETDAPGFALGADLSNGYLYPDAFYSCKLTPVEQNYDVFDKEVLAIKAAFEEWWHLLEGTKFPVQVLTDHKNLEFLKTSQHLNQRQDDWFFFTLFEFMVTYHSGARNEKADALSWKGEYYELAQETPSMILKPWNFILGTTVWDLLPSVYSLLPSDPFAVQIHQALE